jgi:methyl-accepting chemotaxis protein
MNDKNAWSEEQILQPGRASADKVMIGTLVFLLLVSLVIAGFTNTWSVALSVGLPALLVPFAIYRMSPGSLASRIAVACAFMIFSALHIQETRGMIEFHFGIFALLAFLLYYRDWRPIVAAAAVIAVHHLAFNYMQAADLGVYVLIGGPNLPIILLHAAYVVVESAVLIYMAIRLRNEAVESAQVASLAERIGQGDLTQRLDPATLKKLPLLAKVAEMQKQLAATLGSVSAQASEVTQTVQGVAKSAREMDVSMERQSEATSAIAATIEELTVSINHLSETATEAQRLAERSGEASVSGAGVVKSAVSEIKSIASSIGTLAGNMENLGAQFDSVANVVGLIKDIANQTNLLALNAAIEAARAGEQGRGFAVVADEVRKLAERTRQATEEISKTMQEMQISKDSALDGISEAVQKASHGVELASGAGDSIDSISSEAHGVQTMVIGISNALREQSSAANDIAGNIEKITQMNQSSSHAASTTMQDSEALNRIAQSLASSVVRFRLP